MLLPMGPWEKGVNMDMQLDIVGLHVTVSNVGMNEITPRSKRAQNPGDHPHLRDELRNSPSRTG